MERRRAPTDLAHAQTPGEHLPVLLDEVLSWLRPRAGGRYVDCTVGNGGHAAAILTAAEPDGRLLGLDADPVAIGVARAHLGRFGERATLVNASFRDLDGVVASTAFGPIDGI